MANSNERVPMDATDIFMLVLLILATLGVGIYAFEMLGSFLTMH
jgi:hypothetical protein